MTCKTCGEVYPKEQKRKFVNYCCKEQAWASLEKSLGELKLGLENYSSMQELDDFLKANGIQPTEEDLR